MYGLLAEGTILGGRYRLVRALGRGSAGVTYEAIDDTTGGRVAVKQLIVRHATSWKAIDLFEREARVLAALDHPAIPAYLDHFKADLPGVGPALFIARTLVPGESLDEAVRRGRRFSEEAVRRFVTETLLICAYLHERYPPVFHRDIKPGNVILGDDGHVSLVDFGAVRDALASDAAGGSTIAGTFGYMAPEQLRGAALPESDLYGVAATALFMLTGTSPGDLPQKKLKPEFRGVVHTTSNLTDWLDRALEPMPENRFPTARAALDALQSNARVSLRVPAQPPARTWNAAVSRKAIVASVLVALCGAGATVGLRDVIRTIKPALHASGPSNAGWNLPFRLRPARTIAPHATLTHGLAVFPNGREIVTGGDDFAVKVSSLDNAYSPRLLGSHTGKVRAVAVSADGKVVASGGDTTVKLWDPLHGTPLHTLEGAFGETSAVAFFPDGRHVVATGIGGSGKVWDVASGAQVATLVHATGDRLFAVAVSADGEWIATGSANGTVTLFKASGDRVRVIKGAGSTVNALAFAPDAMVLAGACDDHVVRLWQPIAGDLLSQLPLSDDEIWHVAWSRDGRYLLTAGRGESLVVTDMLSRRTIATERTGARGTFGVAFLPSGTEFVTSTGPGVVTTWRLGAPAEVPVPRPDADVEPPPAPGEIGVLLARARTFSDYYQRREAESVLGEVLLREPKNAIAHAFLARAAYRSGQLTNGTCKPEAVAQAKAELAKADAIDPALPESGMVRAYLALFDRDPTRAHEIAIALERSGFASLRLSLLLAQLDLEVNEVDDAERRASSIVRQVREGYLLDSAYEMLSSVYEYRKDTESEAALRRIREEREARRSAR